jgi:hypothetical protein
MEYKIITETSTSSLELKINNMIGKGWKPLGGVSIGTNLRDNKPTHSNYSSQVMLIQTMIKEVVKK